MFVPQETLIQAHPTSLMCWCGAERKRQRLVVEETYEHMGQVLLAYGTLLTAVSLFRYLGRALLSTNDDWTAVKRNLWRARVE